jgi:hypothetical protein
MSAESSNRTIVLVQANPSRTAALGLREEYEAINGALTRPNTIHAFRVIRLDAATDDDLRRALLDFEPEIVHFSGHGAGRIGLVFEEAGEPLFIAGDALASLLGLFSTHVRCVVLNACYSENQAQSISSVVQHVIGMTRAIGDAAAIKFSTGFYDALAAGRSFVEAFHFGCNAISLKGIPESLTPTLITHRGLKPEDHQTHRETNAELQPNGVQQSRITLERSVQELISVLDFRADMILAQIEEDRRKVTELEPAVPKAATEPFRDMKAAPSLISLERFAAKFAELHELNKKALIAGQFVLAHEITSMIQGLLWHRYFTKYSVQMAGEHISSSGFIMPQAWTFASDYPGALPDSLKTARIKVVFMWKRDEEEHRREKYNAKTRVEVIRKIRDSESRYRKVESMLREKVAVSEEATTEKGVLKTGEWRPKRFLARMRWDRLLSLSLLRLSAGLRRILYER